MNSSLIGGVGEDAAFIAEQVVQRNLTGAPLDRPPLIDARSGGSR